MTTGPSGRGTAPPPDPGPLVEALWRRFQPLASQRVAALEAWVGAATAGAPGGPRRQPPPGTRALRDAAVAAAHDLVGSLGSYGRPEGSRLAAACEARVDDPDALVETVARLRAVVGP